VDFGLWALIRSTSTAEQLVELASAGAVGFKAYLGYSFSVSRKQVLHALGASDPDLEAPPDYGTLTRLAPAIAELGLPLVIHAEDPGSCTRSGGHSRRTRTCSRRVRPKRSRSRSPLPPRWPDSTTFISISRTSRARSGCKPRRRPSRRGRGSRSRRARNTSGARKPTSRDSAPR